MFFRYALRARGGRVVFGRVFVKRGRRVDRGLGLLEFAFCFGVTGSAKEGVVVLIDRRFS